MSHSSCKFWRYWLKKEKEVPNHNRQILQNPETNATVLMAVDPPKNKHYEAGKEICYQKTGKDCRNIETHVK
ncbi:MAG TPA: hypothetical protein VHO70_16830 [Chitinispirillaceae bacterium]|nr:hypothetical protein [Chitinispirillaceae bacterium]